jgi:rhamnopyranosyl-N-acetylglucosaminyl-diphospho-decaprenol beta-1,3/1,4-galactofuranosyltransferase
MENKNLIYCVVVTHNRKTLLKKCINSLLSQTQEPDGIIIIDNASTDGTEKLVETEFKNNSSIIYNRLDKNTGGAGGFHFGIKRAIEKGADWIWLMDDDAEPHHDALKNLIYQSDNKNNVYGSVAVANVEGNIKLCFPIKKIFNNKISFLEDYNSLNIIENVVWLPFIGFFIHREAISKVGLPDKDLFIRNDDVEYSERARLHGLKIYIIKASVIEHPFQPTISFNIFGKQIYYKRMPSWKMYYEVRNKIIIAKRYYPVLSGIKSIFGVTLQVFLSILLEKNKMGYLKEYLKGIIDGILTK